MNDWSFRFQTSGLMQAIHIINPLTLTVTKNLTKDQSGDPLTNAGAEGSSGNSSSRVWNDCAFIEVRPCSCWVSLYSGQPCSCNTVALSL